MDYFAINSLRENHAGWSLLHAQIAPLAIAFFMRAFTEPNHRNASTGLGTGQALTADM